MSNEEEIWKTYPDYPFLQASNLGRVRTKDRVSTDRRGRKYHIKGRILKQWRNRGGYVFVRLRVNGKRFNLSVHRVVAICFLPNPDNLPEVNHIDDDPTNNRLDNLEWCTSSYNRQYVEEYGKALGRPVIAVHQETYDVFWFKSQSEVARQLGISLGNINEVIKGKRNKAGGFWFCNADETAIERVRAKFGDKVAEKVEKLISERYN